MKTIKTQKFYLLGVYMFLDFDIKKKRVRFKFIKIQLHLRIQKWIKISILKKFSRWCALSTEPPSTWSQTPKVHSSINQGVPIKKSAGLTPEKALHISFLINDYWATTKKIIQNDLKMADVPNPFTIESNRANKNPYQQRNLNDHHPIVPYSLPLT